MSLNPFSGKNELLVNSETTCSTDTNEITSFADTDVPSCISRCDLTPECGYSFYGEDNSCSLYHTCDEKEDITTIGTTYQKLGNGNDIFRFNLLILLTCKILYLLCTQILIII